MLASVPFPFPLMRTIPLLAAAVTAGLLAVTATLPEPSSAFSFSRFRGQLVDPGRGAAREANLNVSVDYAGPSQTRPGVQLFRVTVTNSGPAAAQLTHVFAELPDHTQLDPESSRGCIGRTTATCRIPLIAAERSMTLMIGVKDFPAGGDTMLPPFCTRQFHFTAWAFSIITPDPRLADSNQASTGGQFRCADAAAACRSSLECRPDQRCSTERGDCRPACPPGAGCPDVCTGVCEPRTGSSSSLSSRMSSSVSSRASSAASHSIDLFTQIAPPTSVRPGQHFNVRVRFGNRGTASAQSVRMRFGIDGPTIDHERVWPSLSSAVMNNLSAECGATERGELECRIGRLPPGMWDIEVPLVAGTFFGGNYFMFELHTDDPEINRENNRSSTWIQVVP